MKNKNTTWLEFKKKIDQTIIYSYNTFNSNKLTKVFLLLFFSLLELYIIKEHTLWRDDCRPILIAKSFANFSDFYTEMRYESTPMLYHLALWLINKIIPLSILSIKILYFFVNFSILVTIIYLLKIPNIYRFLILLQVPILGYLNYIRQYSWAILFILLFTYLYQEKKDKSLWIYVLLFLLCQTTIHSCIAAVGLYIFIIINRFNNNKSLFKPPDAIILVGFSLCCIQITQPPDIMNGLHSLKPFFTRLNLNFTFSFINQVFLVNIISSYGLCIILWLTLKKLYKEDKILYYGFITPISLVALVYYLIGTLRYYSLDRHHWILSFIIIGLLVLVNKKLPNSIKKTTTFTYLLFILLICNSTNLIFTIINCFQSTSSANKVASYLDTNYPNKLTLNEYDFLTDAINIYRKKVHYYYSLNTHRFCKFARWNHQRVDFFVYYKNNGEIRLKVSDFIHDIETTPKEILDKEPIIIISADKFINNTGFTYKNIKVLNKYKLEYLTQYNGGTFENFGLYKLTKL